MFKPANIYYVETKAARANEPKKKAAVTAETREDALTAFSMAFSVDARDVTAKLVLETIPLLIVSEQPTGKAIFTHLEATRHV